MDHAACEYDGRRGGIKSDAETVCGKFLPVCSDPGRPGVARFCREKNDVQPAFLGAAYVVGSAKRQLRQLHVLRRAQSRFSLDCVESFFVFIRESLFLVGELNSNSSKIISTQMNRN